MKSQLTEDFMECFERLPHQIQQLARRNYRVWKDNPAHPSLHFKRVNGRAELCSIRIGIGWRALGRVDGDVVTWFWIGSHAEYDNLLG